MAEKSKERSESQGKASEASPKEGKGEKQKSAAPKAQVADEKPDFKYIVRIANTDLNGKHKLEVALSHVKGIGPRTAGVVSDLVGVTRTEKIGNLSDEQVQSLETIVVGLHSKIPPWFANHRSDPESGDHLHLNGTDLETKLRDDLNRMKKVRSYRGVRHETGQKVRGQRSRSNGRTGLTVGVQRKAVLQAQAPKKEEGKKEEKAPAKEEKKPAAAAAPAKKEAPKK